MRLFPAILATVTFAVVGCETDRSVNDTDYVDNTDRTRVIGTDDYEHGVPDRTSTERGVDQGGIAQPSRDQSKSDLSTLDRTFIEEAAIGGLFEVRSAELALEHDDDPQVKQIASMILEDHRKAHQELEALAQRKGMSVPRQLSPRYQEMLTQLQSAQGDAFATSFRDVQEKAHEDAIRLFERQAREGHDADLKSFAERTLPVLRKHLDHVQQYNAPSPYNPSVSRV